MEIKTSVTVDGLGVLIFHVENNTEKQFVFKATSTWAPRSVT